MASESERSKKVKAWREWWKKAEEEGGFRRRRGRGRLAHDSVERILSWRPQRQTDATR
jgi:hypothetical protein